MLIYKILLPGEWAEFEGAGRFDGSQFDHESGFIHCSSREQVGPTALRVFPAERTLVVAAVDADALGVSVRWEESTDGGFFPHVYGPVPREAVTAVYEVAGAAEVERALPEASMRERLDETIAAGLADGLHAVVVVQGGRKVLEHYGTGADFSWNTSYGTVDFGPRTLHDVRSVTKSVTSLLYGIALGQGLVPEPSASLLAGFPEYPDLAADPERARLTVEHALTMSLGMEWKEEIPYNGPANAEIAMELAPDRYRFVLERPIVEPPGVHYSYSGGATALLGGLIARGAGRPLPDFAREVLFGPLGIDRFEWMAGPDGVASAASGLRLAAPDLARVGELVLAGGEWDGRQVVPGAWLAAMLEPRLPVEWGRSYGYQWYNGEMAGHRWVGAMGNGGQRLTILPDLGLVVAIAAGNYDDPEQWRTPEAVLERVVLRNAVGSRFAR